MPPSLVPIVEGYGEVEAVPILLRRLLESAKVYQVGVARPIRIPKTRLLKKGGIENAVRLARLHPACAGIIIILDADDDQDCPKRLAPILLKRARRTSPSIPVSVVLAKREYEAWFIGCIDSLRGQRGISDQATRPANPEEIRDAKTWLSRSMDKKYKETIDQAALSKGMDLN